MQEVFSTHQGTMHYGLEEICRFVNGDIALILENKRVQEIAGLRETCFMLCSTRIQ